MKDVIDLLYDIEEKANTIIDQTSAEKKALHEQLTKDINTLNEKTKNTTKEKLITLQEKLKKEIAEEHQQLLKDFEENYHNLNENFERNQDILANNLFQKIIGE